VRLVEDKGIIDFLYSVYMQVGYSQPSSDFLSFQSSRQNRLHGRM